MTITTQVLKSYIKPICFVLLSFNIILLTNCANNTAIYDSENNTASLLVPPTLANSSIDNSYAIINKQTIDPQNQLQTTIVQNGKQIWLEISDQNLATILPLMQSYLKNLGLSVAKQDVRLASIETDWATTNNNLTDKSGIRYLFDKIGMGKMYSLPSKYKFIINLWQDNNKVKIFVTVEQANETYTTGKSNTSNRAPSAQMQTKWVMLKPKIQNEIDFLGRFISFANNNQISIPANESSLVTPQINQANIESSSIIIHSDIDNAFDKTIASLNKVGLGIKSQDKHNFTIIAYPLPEYIKTDDDSWFSGLFSRKAKLAKDNPQYLITLTSTDDTNTKLDMLLNNATSIKKDTKQIANDATITNYLNELYLQLK